MEICYDQNTGFLRPIFHSIRFYPYVEKYGSEKIRILAYLRNVFDSSYAIFVNF